MTSRAGRKFSAKVLRKRRAVARAAAEKDYATFIERFGQREHLKGVAVSTRAAAALAITCGLRRLKMRPTAALAPHKRAPA